MNQNKIFFVVDDDEIFRFITEKTIEQINSEIVVHSFTDGQEAIDHLTLCKNNEFELPELILLDINMPFLDGWGFLEKFKTLKNDLSKKPLVYLVTSSDHPDDIKKAKDVEELSGYVIKPIKDIDIKKVLDQYPAEMWPN